jgi:hypothetical protein
MTPPPAITPATSVPPTCAVTPTVTIIQPSTLLEDPAVFPREYGRSEAMMATEPTGPTPLPIARVQNAPLPAIHSGVADSADSVAHMDYFTLTGVTVRPQLSLPSPPGLSHPEMPNSPATAAALALIDLSTTTAAMPAPVMTSSTVSAPSALAARTGPTPISYQDIVTSLERSVESQGIRTRPARRRGGCGRPPMPRLPAAALRRPNTTPNLQMTIGTGSGSREVRVQHDTNLPSLGDTPEL